MVLGHRGMLGHVVAKVFSEHGYQVLTTNARYTGHESDELIRECARSHAALVINCIGIRKGDALQVVNGLLPQHLAVALGRDRRLFHASSDGVFTGRRGPYEVTRHPDAIDPYGTSKRLGELCLHCGPEAARVSVVRTSVVGPELAQSRSLLAWFLGQTGEVTGYENQLWSGVTTLAWARFAVELANSGDGFSGGVHQLAPEVGVSKRELLQLFAGVFGHDLRIRGGMSEVDCDRRLVPTTVAPPIDQQLRELQVWYWAGKDR
jgi:dTDP-4-dehydrorhamnose reductase